MVWVRATVLGRLGRKPSPHPRAHALSCPPPAIHGPGLGHFTRPALCHLAGAFGGSGLSLYPGGAIVLTAVSDARVVLGAEEVAGPQIGSSVSVIGGVSLI